MTSFKRSESLFSAQANFIYGREEARPRHVVWQVARPSFCILWVYGLNHKLAHQWATNSVALGTRVAGSPGPYWTCVMCQIACNKEMPSSHLYITLAALDWLTINRTSHLVLKLVCIHPCVHGLYMFYIIVHKAMYNTKIKVFILPIIYCVFI